MSDHVHNPKQHAQAAKAAKALYRAMHRVAQEQTAELLARAKAVVEGGASMDRIEPIYLKELVTAIKRGMVESFKAGRTAMRKKIALGIMAAPKSVRELMEPGKRVLARVRELDADVLQYEKVAQGYEKWASEVIGGRLGETVAQAKQIIADGVREGTPWNDFAWDKEAGKNLKEGLRTQLERAFTDYEEWQLLRVAVTEHTRAVGMGDIAEIRKDEMCNGGIWHVDYKGCEICSPRNGQRFTADWLEANFPGHPNCYCTIDPSFSWEPGEVHDSWDEVAA